MHPAVDADLVLLRRREDRVDGLGMKLGGDCRNEEAGGDVVFLEELQDSRDADPRAVLAARERLRRIISRAEKSGFGIHIERESYRDAGSVRPAFGREVAAGPDFVDHRFDLREVPFPDRRS